MKSVVSSPKKGKIDHERWGLTQSKLERMLGSLISLLFLWLFYGLILPPSSALWAFLFDSMKDGVYYAFTTVALFQIATVWAWLRQTDGITSRFEAASQRSSISCSPACAQLHPQCREHSDSQGPGEDTELAVCHDGLLWVPSSTALHASSLFCFHHSQLVLLRFFLSHYLSAICPKDFFHKLPHGAQLSPCPFCFGVLVFSLQPNEENSLAWYSRVFIMWPYLFNKEM